MKIVNIKKEETLISQYVELRNKYKTLLLTSSVTIDETKKWLKSANVEVWGIVESGTLMGVVVLYLERNGEIALFTREKGKGYGSKLLTIAENVARKRGLKTVWAQVLKDNQPAIRVFKKNAYEHAGIVKRKYNNTFCEVVLFKKHLKNSSQN